MSSSSFYYYKRKGFNLELTYYVVAHFHYVLSIGAIFSIYAGLYYWIPKMLGVYFDDRLAAQHFWSMLIGVNVTFMPQHFSGLQGIINMP